MSVAIKELIRQHHSADNCLAQCHAALNRAEPAVAAQHFSQFDSELRAHIRLEEERLFPAFEQATGNLSGPTMVMRTEHVDMLALCGEIHAQLAQVSAGNAQALLARLGTVLEQHSLKEETVLYPMCAARINDLSGVLGMGSGCCGACSCG
ncbi:MULTISPECIES: hemerythrin domain-containing protein [unclassified Undibacterium]|uniref:hemerythrin domain-containing protein n=1 Tax=unclassified Undibacterium TaxID=2630295 RepID=UPI002AC9D92D|nr:MULTISPECIES: hemerythrin domain-containing protein [unclassified Undibacterium]MEB0138090.1 hemerythrin domain-containing protein [Undibacterium sp. CCC2.1]MEB0171172.1 hemerythrin domain-containing protein [Undibacterium sp. CCC1.1]MEB0175217.1 hemerythrin domain-containing protein [Undibacterium sp. CCC3.4]MEB0214625.1 hemerythrin domain-containing protein [Undibacterium sp. 5I2]WPX42393.1 hemerythrin domain-containing protein [Undibacterium sp. CCC3.4]